MFAIIDSAPLSGLTTGYAQAIETAPQGSNWRVIAVAVCANVTLSFY